jgi:hypothetical protein
MLIAIGFEERDLLVHFGPDYREWRARTPLFMPRVGGRAGDRGRAPADRRTAAAMRESM